MVLDCGCGEGHNSREIANTATKVIGYDIKSDPHWAGRAKENLVLTQDKAMVSEHGPYDLIVLYDVLDHLQSEDPEPFMQWIASLLNINGRIFLRAHPWTSKTGGHFYEAANKAWLHLVMTPDELVQAGLVAKEPNLRIIRPMAAYELWFKNAGLIVENKKVKSDAVDEFFLGDLIDRIVKVTFGGTADAETAKRIMSNSWIDYFLKK